MWNEEELLLPLKTILVNLKVIASKVRTNPSFRQKMQKQLIKDCGYNRFGGIPKSDEVMKALADAVSVALQENNDLHFIPVEYELRSPLDLAKYLKKTETKSAPQWLVKNIIQHQFDIRWNTPDGDPNDYTFYEFCDNENTTELLKYIPREAHVKATLYKECRKINASSLQEITEKKENLCPTVYIRVAGGWKSWRADEDGFNDIDVEDINTDSWIDSSIFTFITENADEQNNDDESLKKSLSNHTLYWAVLKDSDFKSGDRMKLKKIGRTQVYVGRANKGIKGRWARDGKNHCKMMKTCLDNVCAMTTYDPLRLKGITLVDARLALAKVRGEETALFVIKTFGDDVEKAEIAQEKAEVSLRKAKASLDGAETEERKSILKEEVAERQEELDKAIVVTERFKSEAEALLTIAETLHLDGKRVNDSSENIIDMTWTPKNMGYGMNFK